MYSRPWIFGLIAPAVLTACHGLDPNHCTLNGGHRACGQGLFCNPCKTDGNGCVASAVEAECLQGDLSTGSTGAAPTGSGTGPYICVGNDAFDPGCPEAEPICRDASCTSCEETPHLCPAGEICTNWGGCVECDVLDPGACAPPSSFCGQSYECGGCIEHCQCGDPNCLTENLATQTDGLVAGTCDLKFGECHLCDFASGVCIQDPRTIWVTNAETCGSEPSPTGSLDKPFCSITDGLAEMDDPGVAYVMVIRNESDKEFRELFHKVDDQAWTLALIGENRPKLVPPSSEPFALRQGNLYISGVEILDAVGDGLRCVRQGQQDRPELRIDDAVLRGNRVGVSSSGCKVDVRRSVLFRNELYGIEASQGSLVRIESSVITRHDSEEQTGELGISARGQPGNPTRVEISYSTVVANRTTIDGGINIGCGEYVEFSVQNSVVLGLERECPGAAVSSSDELGNIIELGGMSLNRWFEDLTDPDFPDLHVKDPLGHAFEGVAHWQLGDPFFDLDGELIPRYPGAPGFAGADQPTAEDGS